MSRALHLLRASAEAVCPRPWPGGSAPVVQHSWRRVSCAVAEFEEEDEDDGAGWGSGVHAEGSIYSDHPHTPGSQEDSQDSADQDVPETEDDEDDEADDEERGRGRLGKRGAAIRPIRTVAPVVRTESCLSLTSLLVRWVVACPVSVRGRCLIGAACGVCAGWQGGVAALPVQGGPLLWRHGAHATGTSGGRHGRRREACGCRHREGEQRHPQVRLGLRAAWGTQALCAASSLPGCAVCPGSRAPWWWARVRPPCRRSPWPLRRCGPCHARPFATRTSSASSHPTPHQHTSRPTPSTTRARAGRTTPGPSTQQERVQSRLHTTRPRLPRLPGGAHHESRSLCRRGHDTI